MKSINKALDHIHDELEGAKEYAEKYIRMRSFGDSDRASLYKSMATDELHHAEVLHKFALEDVAKIEKVYELPEDIREEWEHGHKKLIECMAIVKRMLGM